MPYHAHKIGDVLGLTDDQQRQDQDLIDHTTDPNGHPPFAGVGTTGFVPDPTDLQGQFLRDDGTWADGTVVEYSANAVNGVGDGTIEGDFNANDWTGHPYAVGENLNILLNHVVTCTNGGGVAYSWVGPKNVLIGPSGNYTALATDFVAKGTNDHSVLINVNPDDHHNRSHDHSDPLDGQVPHGNLIGIGANDHHNQIHLLYGSDHSDVLTGDALQEGDALVWNGSAFAPSNVGSTELTFLLLYGTATVGSVGSGGNYITNYAESGQASPVPGIFVDPVTGIITLPEAGVYEVTLWVIGQQGNDTKEESMFLQIEVGGVLSNAAVFDIATDKTDYRSFTAVITRSETAGTQLRLRMRATSGTGTFSIENTSFQVTRLL